jgi:hypothetical protein
MPSRVVGKDWDRSRDVMFRNERKNSNLSKTSIVEFTCSLSFHCLLANSREVNCREDHGGVFSSLHVVSSLVSLRVQLSNEDGGQDLGLSCNRDGSPSFRWAHGSERFEANIAGELSREMNSSSVGEISNGGNHGATAVLELGGTVPAEGFIGSLLSEV